MEQSIQKEVIVLGMHRSGTSMIAGILESLGVDLGEDQLGKEWSNPLGHFEDVDFLSLNKAILASAGGSWKDPPSLTDIITQGKKYQSEIKELILERNQRSSGSPWGWKDPRTSLTIELYLPHLVNPYLIWCKRDQLAISRSLQKRNQIPVSDSQALHEYYENQIEDFIIKHPELPVVTVDYDEVIQAPERWINDFIQYLQLTPDQYQIDQALNKILSPGKLQRKKWMVWISWLASAPIRFMKRLFREND